MTRWILLLLVAGWGLQPSAAQRHTLPSQNAGLLKGPSGWRVSAAAETTASSGSRYRYIESFGGGLLGAAIGGGLGALVGSVTRAALSGERYRRSSRYDRDDKVMLAPLGIWAGSVVGAMAGGRTEVQEDVAALSMVGSALGFFIGFGAFAVASDGHEGWTVAGLGVGAAAGAAFGAVVWAPEYRGLIRHDGEQWTVGVPAMQWQPALRHAEASQVHIVFLSARL